MITWLDEHKLCPCINKKIMNREMKQEQEAREFHKFLDICDHNILDNPF